MIQAVIFDHDGTLVDSEPVHFEMWRITLAEYGVELTRAFYRQHLSGKPTIDSAEYLVSTHRLKADPQDICRIKLERIREYLQVSPFPLFAQVKPLLTWLNAEGLALAVASGAARHEVESSLKAHALTPYFTSVSTREDVNHNKPAADVYLHSATALGLAPSQCVAVEDSDCGQLAARAAGMTCLRLNTFTRLAPDPHCVVIERLADLRVWLASKPACR